MALTPIPALSTIPRFPALSDRATGLYNGMALAFGRHMGDTFPGELSAITTALMAWTDFAASEASRATQAAASAASVQGVVLGAANFKGLWPDLAGPLNKPACVKHNGRFWLLLNNLPNVAASQPGISADWTSLDAGVTPSQVITANTVAVPGVRYILGANGIKLDLSAVAYSKGDYQGIRVADGFTGCQVEFGALKYLGRTIGTLLIDVPLFRLDLNYESNTVGMH